MRQVQQLLSAALCALALVAMSVPAVALVPTAPQANDKININTASAGELTRLPGIGPARADAIIAYRAEHGPFARVDDLTRVRGIGQGILAKIRDMVTVGERDARPAKPAERRE